MRRLLGVLVAASLCGLGCGHVEPLDVRSCPSGKDVVHATDVIGQPPPKGYDIDPGDKQALKAVAEQFKARIGDSWRGYDGRVLVRHNEANGTAVLVINSSEKTGGSSALIEGAESGAKEAGQTAERLTIAGNEGRMVQSSDGAYIAMAPTGRCAVVMLIADRAELVRNTADVIPAQ
jgi:hypothetical protein